MSPHSRTRPRRLVFWALLFTIFSLGCSDCCCDGWGCCCEGWMTPSDAELGRLVGKRLAKDEQNASTICGVQATGLRDIEVRPWSRWLQLGPIGYVRVEGQPREASRGKRAAQALTCSAVFFYMVDSKRKGKSLEWELMDLDLIQVDTAGVDWESPSSSGDWDWD